MELHLESMSTTHDNGRNEWRLIADVRFEDFEEFSEAVDGWDFDFRQMTAGRSQTSMRQIGNSEFMLSRFYFEQAYEQYVSLSPDTLSFGIHEAGVNETVTPVGLMQQNDLLFLPLGRELVAVTQPHFKGHTVSISEALINEVAESCGLQKSGFVSHTTQKVLRCDPEKMEVVRKTLWNLSRSLEQIKKADNYSEIFPDLEFRLIQHLLLTASESRPTDKLRISKIKRVRLQRALDFIDANADKPITVLELARETGSTVRTLEYIFRDYFDVTPKAYLKSRRMTAVRRELHSASDRKGTVSEIANRWGFWHMSQFAADYRRFFGELPSATLNRTR